MDSLPSSVLRLRAVRFRRTDVIATAVMCLAGFGVLAGFVSQRYGSVASALASAEGRGLLPDAPTKPFGDVDANGTSTVSYTLRNLTGHPIRLQGAQVYCACLVIDGVPGTIEARGTRVITATVRVGSEPEQLEGSFQLFTDDVDEPAIRLGYTGRVVPIVDPAR